MGDNLVVLTRGPLFMRISGFTEAFSTPILPLFVFWLMFWVISFVGNLISSFFRIYFRKFRIFFLHKIIFNMRIIMRHLDICMTHYFGNSFSGQSWLYTSRYKRMPKHMWMNIHLHRSSIFLLCKFFFLWIDFINNSFTFPACRIWGICTALAGRKYKIGIFP